MIGKNYIFSLVSNLQRVTIDNESPYRILSRIRSIIWRNKRGEFYIYECINDIRDFISGNIIIANGYVYLVTKVKVKNKKPIVNVEELVLDSSEYVSIGRDMAPFQGIYIEKKSNNLNGIIALRNR